MSRPGLKARGAAMSATALLIGSVVVAVNHPAASATATLNIVGQAGSGAFGTDVTVLSNGNFVVVDSVFDSATQPDVGAVYLYNGATNALISRVTGSTAGDSLGDGGLTEVGSSDFVVRTTSWDNVAVVDAGAVTWVDGTTGLNGQVSSANSLVGTTAADTVGNGGVTALSNGNYVVRSTAWDNGAGDDAGAVTWGNGTTGVKGPVTAANSLVGTTALDAVGVGGVTALPINGNYVVGSPAWDNGAVIDAGAVTWGNGATGVSGAVSASNSLVGTTASDAVGTDDLGLNGITALVDGDYVVVSAAWDDTIAALVNAGAATWGSGITGVSGAVTAANSLVGDSVGDRVGTDFVGIGAVTPLTNGNYVVTSAAWDDGGSPDAGAVTWGNGNGATVGVVTAANSLVGGRADDHVGTTTDGINAVTALPGGNYVVTSTLWGDGGGSTTADVGAVTRGSGTGGTVGEVTEGNSIVGTTDGDQIGSGGVTPLLTSGNYVVSSPLWDNGAAVDAGAVTRGLGAGGTVGTVSAANSLVGTTTDDNIGGDGVTALTNGNYVVISTAWDNAAVGDAGAVTRGNGTTGTIGVVSAANSLVGSTLDDAVGNGGVTVLTNGNYVVVSPLWNNAGVVDAGAATWGDGTAGVSGAVSSANSLVGSIALDNVGNAGVTSLANGNYVVDSDSWNNGAVVAAGAVTWGNGALGRTGAVSVANSLVGTTAFDVIGRDGVVPLTNGDYVVTSAAWDNGSVVDAGAVTWGSGATGRVGAVTSVNSLVGTTSNDLVGTDTSASNGVTALPGGSYSVVSASWNNGAIVDAGAATFGPTGGLSGPITATNSALGTSPGSVESIADRFTPDDALVVSTGQNRVLLLRVGAQSPVFPTTPGNVTASTAPGAANAVVNFSTPVATAKSGTPSVACIPASGAVFPIGVSTVTCTATDSARFTATTSFSVTVNATPSIPPSGPGSSDQVSLSPARLADTRPGQSTVDTLFAGGGIREGGSTLELTVAGRGGVTLDATAVALNVTAVDSTQAGFVTIYPCGSPQPTASNLNIVPGATVPNAVIAGIGSGGAVCLFASAATHLVVDVGGYFPSTTSLRAMNPARMLDTRGGQPAPAAGSTTVVQITGRESIPADASAVVVNVTVTEAQAAGFATVFPCGTDVPTASSINYTAGATVANLVIAKIGAGGAVCIFTQSSAQLIADVSGYFPATTSYKPLDPARLLDTRIGAATTDGQFFGAGLRPAGTVTELTVVNRGGVPASVATVVMNVTATEPTAAGFVTVYPCGIDRPLASNVNYGIGATVANAVMARVAANGTVCLFNSNPTHLVVDVNGYLTN